MSSSRYPSIAGIDGTGSAGEIAIWDDSAVLGGESTLTYSSNQLAITSLTNDKELLKLVTNSTNTYARITVINSDATRYFQLATTFDATQVPAMAEHLTIGSDSTTIMSFGRSGQVFLNQSGASAPSPTLVHRNFPDTGLYWPGSDVLGIAADGTSVATLASSGVAIKATNTNDSAASGWVGQYSESTGGDSAWAAATEVYDNVATISLGSGNWIISASCTVYNSNAAGITLVTFGISSDATATTFSDRADGRNAYQQTGQASAGYTHTATVANLRVTLASTTSYYMKLNLAFGGGTPHVAGYKLSAMRPR